MIDFETLLAARLDLPFDYEKIGQELLSCRPYWSKTPIWQSWIDMAETGTFFKVESDDYYNRITRSYKNNEGKILVDKREFEGFYNLYLRSPEDESKFIERSFNRTKYLNHERWQWRKSLESKISYTIKCIESLPYKSIGLIRVFITENTFFPTHFDYDYNLDKSNTSGKDDISKTLGLSIIPLTGGCPLKIWSVEDNSVKEIYGNAMLFRDSQPHGVPFTKDTRITIRIFGEIDFKDLERFIDQSSIKV